MSFGYYPCHAHEVGEKFIAEICPHELKRFKEQLAAGAADYPAWIRVNESMNDLAEFPHPEGVTADTWFKVVNYWYVRLVNKFARKTGIGIALDQWREDAVIGNNDCPERADGCYWRADDHAVFTYTRAARKIKQHIHTLEWVEGG